MLALGTLSGQYLETNADGTQSVLSKEETQLVQGAFTIIFVCQNKNKNYCHKGMHPELTVELGTFYQ